MDRVLTRLIFSIFLVALIASGASIASGVELYIPAINGRYGHPVDIPVMLDKVDNLAGIKLTIKYDPKILQFNKGKKTTQTDPLMHIINDKKPGVLIVVMAGARGIKGKDFPILLLTFLIKKEDKGEHNTSLTITEVQLISDQLKDIKCDIKVDPLNISP